MCAWTLCVRAKPQWQIRTVVSVWARESFLLENTLRRSNLKNLRENSHPGTPSGLWYRRRWWRRRVARLMLKSVSDVNPEEFLNTLDILRSNKEFFSGVLNDPESLFVKHLRHRSWTTNYDANRLRHQNNFVINMVEDFDHPRPARIVVLKPNEGKLWCLVGLAALPRALRPTQQRTWASNISGSNIGEADWATGKN